MIPTPGRIVLYTLTEWDVQAIGTQRSRGAGPYFKGNPVSEGDVFPLQITRVWAETEGGSVNGQVLLDGNDVLWVTSRTEGTGPGFWKDPRSA